RLCKLIDQAQIRVIRLQIRVCIAERRNRFGLLIQLAVGVEDVLGPVLFRRFGQRAAGGFHPAQRRRIDFQNRLRGVQRLAGGLGLLVDRGDERAPARDSRLFAFAQFVFRVGEKFVYRVVPAIVFELLPRPFLFLVAGGGRGEDQTDRLGGLGGFPMAARL